MDIFGVVIIHQDKPLPIIYYFFQLKRLNTALWWVRVAADKKPMHGTFPILGEYDIMDADIYLIHYNENHLNNSLELDFRATCRATN